MKNNKISVNLAQEIVNAVKEVVDKDINFIDKTGIIIGSTNKKRLKYKASLMNLSTELNNE